MSNSSDLTESSAADAAADPAAAPAGEASALLAQLDAAQAESAKWKDQALRAAADLENFRRRAARDKDETRRFANAAILEDLLPVLDNLRLGLQSVLQAHPEAGAVIDGIKLVADQLRSALAQHGLQEILPAVGAPFDPQRHEAVAHQPSAEVAAEHVLQVLRPGYVLNDRLLRAASVVVSAGGGA